MESQFLPIGTVVQLKNSTACVMIAGYLPVGPGRPGYVWDYSGMRFPLGYMSDEEIYCFDQNQIEIVHALGYQDQEQFAFIRTMNNTAEKIKAETMAREGQDQQ